MMPSAPRSTIAFAKTTYIIAQPKFISAATHIRFPATKACPIGMVPTTRTAANSADHIDAKTAPPELMLDILEATAATKSERLKRRLRSCV